MSETGCDTGGFFFFSTSSIALYLVVACMVHQPFIVDYRWGLDGVSE